MNFFKKVAAKWNTIEQNSDETITEFREEYNQQLISSNNELQEFEEDPINEHTFSSKTIATDVQKKTQLHSPKKYSEIQPIIDHLIKTKILLIDFSNLEPGEKRRVKDFLSGVTYSLNGEHKRIENEVYKFIVRN